MKLPTTNHQLQTTNKGVSLYLALMIMFILIAIGLGVSLIIVSQMKMIRGMADSVVAFYAADTGIEKSLYLNLKEGQSGAIDPAEPVGGATYKVIAEISGLTKSWKSVGAFSGTKRAVEISRPISFFYMCSDQYTITAYKLEEIPTNSALNSSRTIISYDGEFYDVEWGIRVWQVASDGSKTEIEPLSGYKAVVSRTSNQEGIQTATWTFPGIPSMDPNDALLVEVYIRFVGGEDWTKLVSFITKPLGVSSLNSGTWRVYYYTQRETVFYPGGGGGEIPPRWKTEGTFFWGDSGHESKIGFE